MTSYLDDTAAIELAILDGMLLHPVTVVAVVERVRAEDFTTEARREMYRGIVRTWLGGYMDHEPNGYVGYGRYLVANDRWAGHVYDASTGDAPGDPVAAADILAERSRRRRLAAELALAAEAVANGASLDHVRLKLEAVAA